MNLKKLLYATLVFSALFLIGCANAGKDQKVEAGETVTLDGSESKADFYGEIKKYKWKQVKNKHFMVEIVGKNTEKPTFIAPNVTKKTRLTFVLNTLEKGGIISSWHTQDRVDVIVSPTVAVNVPPQAVATASTSTVKEGNAVTFDASSSSDSDGQIVSYLWSDASGATLSSESSFEHTFATLGEHTLTLKVTDDAGAEASTTVTVKVEALQKPIARIHSGATMVTTGSTVTFDANGSTDSDGQIVSYTWKDAQGTTLSNEKSFSHTFDVSGEQNISLEVLDDDGQLGLASVNIVVQALLTSVELSIETNTLEINQTTILHAIAYYNDNTSQDVSSSVTWEVADDVLLSIDANATLTALKGGSTQIKAKVGEVASNAVQIEILPQDTTPPVLKLNGEAELTLIQGTAYVELGATATDDRDENVSVTTSGEVDVAVVGDYSITYTAEDKAGNEANIIRVVHVVLPPDTTPPVLTLNGENTLTLRQGSVYTELGAMAMDERDGNVSVVIVGSVETAIVGTYTITYSAEDKAGNKASITRTITVIDVTPPLITLNGESSITLEQNAVYNELGAISFDAVDGNVSVSIIGNIDTSVVGTYVITYTTQDSAGNEANVTRTITITDVIPPVITLNGEANITLEQNAVYTELGATALDAVDGNVSVTISGIVDTSTVGSYTVTYTATDSAGNEANTTRTITIIDVTPPVITLNGESNITLEQNAVYTELGATAVDAVDGNVTVTTTGTVDTATVGTYTIVYSATDSVGNEANLTRTMRVIDVTPPVLILNGDEIVTLLEDDAYVELGATAQDGVDGNVTVTISGTVDTATIGEYILTYTATDSSGNSASMSRTVQVEQRFLPPSISISEELESTLAQSVVPYDRITLEISATSTVKLTALNQTLAEEQNRSIELKGVDNHGMFYLYNIPLVKGTNTIRLQATNEADEMIEQNITINAEVNSSVPIGMYALKYEGVQSLETSVLVRTALDAKEYLFDSEGNGMIDVTQTDGNFTVSYRKEGRYKPRVTVRTTDGLLYSSSNNFSISLDVKASATQKDPKGAEAIDVAKAFVQAIIDEDREKVESLIGHNDKLEKVLYTKPEVRVFLKSIYSHITQWSQTYHQLGDATISITYEDNGTTHHGGFELMLHHSHGLYTGRKWTVRMLY